MTLYLKNALYLDYQSLDFQQTGLAVEEGPQGGLRLIKAVPPLPERQAGDRVIDCRGKLVTRSFVCGHHHIYSALSRGMPPSPVVPANFAEVLEHVWWRLDKCLDNQMTEASALFAAMGCAKRGVTFIIDHHASPFQIRGSLETIAQAFERVGVGHLLCYEISDRDGPQKAQDGLDEHDDYLAGGRPALVGLHASFTVGDETLKKSVDLARKYQTGLHIHVAEAQSDQEDCLARHQLRVAQRLHKFGVLDQPHSILGHCVHLDEHEKKLVAESRAWVVQSCESNQNNNVGLTGYGWTPRVMLGVDGMHNDMIRSAQAAYLAGQSSEGISPAALYARFRAAHRYLAETGAPGDGDNNLVIMNYQNPTPLHRDNFPGHFAFGFSGSDVETVVSQGRVIVENGRLITEDEESLVAYAREQARRLWDKMSGGL
ncbi:MAG: amidohydrolase family protein [Candidatus Adiutrix sp.]|jgi:cytosine/adenosine deaminase-related metal-dependent hydrolase|nr:amidohydrolase family protein [Candidatus Adiutrix sp.]